MKLMKTGQLRDGLALEGFRSIIYKHGKKSCDGSGDTACRRTDREQSLSIRVPFYPSGTIP